MLYSKVKKSRNSFKSLVYALIFFIIIQAAIGYYVNLGMVYHYRLDYKMFLNNKKTIEVVVEEIARTIKKRKLEDYIILIGNSVAWGTNETSDHSLGKYLNDLAAADSPHRQVVFNLSAPSMHAGDIYTLLLMLEKQGIPAGNLMVGLGYSAFADLSSGPRAVFWLGDYLRELDRKAFADVREQIVSQGYKYKSGWDYVEDKYMHKALSILPLYKYKDVIESYRELQEAGTDLLGDPRPWHEKPYPAERLESKEYLKFFDSRPFVMDEHNWGIYFMNKILEHQQGKRTLVFVAGGNSELTRKEVTHPGYQSNLKLIEQFFNRDDVIFVQMQDKISPDLFTDHVHLTKEGNQVLASILWRNWLGEEV